MRAFLNGALMCLIQRYTVNSKAHGDGCLLIRATERALYDIC